MLVGVDADSVRFRIDMQDVDAIQHSEHDVTGDADPDRDADHADNLCRPSKSSEPPSKRLGAPKCLRTDDADHQRAEGAASAMHREGADRIVNLHRLDDAD